MNTRSVVGSTHLSTFRGVVTWTKPPAVHILALAASLALIAGCTAAAPATTLTPAPVATVTPTLAATLAPPRPTPSPAPSVAPFVIGTLEYPGTVAVGGAIRLTVTVKNTGGPASLTFGVQGLDDQTFIGCKPACSHRDTLSAVPAPALGKSVTYTLVWQAIRPQRAQVYVSLGSGLPFDHYAEWFFEVVVLI